MQLNSLFKLIFWLVFFEVVGFLLGLTTQANLYPWYENLNKSALTPPGYVFSIVWTILYGLLALITWMILNKKPPQSFTTLFIIQMLMNWLWTPLFFHFHYLTLSAVWIIVLVCINVILAIKFRTENKLIVWLLIPYILWLTLASYLNGFIAVMN